MISRDIVFKRSHIYRIFLMCNEIEFDFCSHETVSPWYDNMFFNRTTVTVLQLK